MKHYNKLTQDSVIVVDKEGNAYALSKHRVSAFLQFNHHIGIKTKKRKQKIKKRESRKTVNEKAAKRRLPSAIRLLVLNRDRSTCQLCGATAPDVKIEIDHIVPVSKGGSNEPENLQCLCSECNKSKSDKIELHINAC